MPKEEWGVKRVCPKCSVRFYDLGRDPMTCPSCGTSFDVASLTQQKTRADTPEKAIEKAAPVAAAVDDVADVEVLVEEVADVADDLADDLLDDDDDDTVNLEEIADVPVDDDES